MSADGDILLPALTASGTGLRGTLGAGAITLPALTASGALDGPLQLPALTLAGTALPGAVARGATLLPSLTAAGSAMLGTAARGDIRLPALTLESRSIGGAITLPALSASGTGKSGNRAIGSLALPALTASGTLRFDNNAVGAVLLPALQAAGSARAAARIDGAITLPSLSLAAAALSGQVGTASITLPMLTVNGRTGAWNNTGTADITLPMLAVDGQAQQSVDLTGVTFTGIALNTRTRAVSTYAGLAPNSLARFAGLTLMATADGIVALSAEDDAGTPIAAHVTLGKTDFNAPGLTRVLTGYVGLRATGALELTLITDDYAENVYTLEPDEIDAQHVARVKLGKGVKGTYWQAKLANTGGCDFAIDSLLLQPALVGGRV